MNKSAIVRAVMNKLGDGSIWETVKLYQTLAANPRLDALTFAIVITELEDDGHIDRWEHAGSIFVRRALGKLN